MKFYKYDGARLCKTFKDDCVVRSVSVALRKPYAEVFHDLMDLGKEIGAYPNHEKVWQKYIQDKGFVKHRPPRNEKGKYIRLVDWQFTGTAVVVNHGHLTAVDEGTVIDSWDCRYRPVNSYWAKR